MSIATYLKAALLGAALLGPSVPALAADWTIDPAHSTLAFTGTQTGAKFTGHFKSFGGTIRFDPAHPDTGHALIAIDIASAATGDAQRDEAIPGADWFNVAQFPKATFEATGFQPKGGNAYEAHGTLTIRGISHPETLPFTLDITGNVAHAKGHLDLVRSSFGVGQGPWASGQWVALEAGVDIDITAQATP
ncbi:hypothetical protein AA13595_2312 [Gluconacetobacter johannae DSM 13595]|uniref:YceI family protein n=1 Tax=Gluconacetobacter johannae TaxID=112140 RepID=A0A7W4P5M5_9PROT|nr:YceI family protein [Gluconacetobacter johannae]MBB2174990.1 YceI family protein [Gluconacetobacter johannae]GBQ88076.1 hypothetical protein AA13595_2312 [Gluconacetobacter johannae DSM 13595]